MVRYNFVSFNFALFGDTSIWPKICLHWSPHARTMIDNSPVGRQTMISDPIRFPIPLLISRFFPSKQPAKAAAASAIQILDIAGNQTRPKPNRTAVSHKRRLLF